MSEATKTDQPSAPLPIAAQPKKEYAVVHDDSPLSFMLDTAKFEHLYRVASVIASASLTPKHLKGETQAVTIANCFRVVNQAMRWGMDPFAVVDTTYVVNGKLGYEGKLVAAVVNARAGLVGRLRVTYSGAGKQRKAVVAGRFQDEKEDRTIDITVEQAATQNKMWTDDPDQKLWYSGATKWARRHCPDILLGVMSDDELEQMKDEQIKAAMSGLADAPPVGKSNLREPKNGSPEPEQEQPQGNSDDEPQADAGLTADIEDELRRTGLAGTLQVDEMARAAGAERFHGIKQGQAEKMLAELRNMKSAEQQQPETVPADPQRRFSRR